MSSHLSLQWLCGNSCTHALGHIHDVQLHIAGTMNETVFNKLSKEHKASVYK